MRLARVAPPTVANFLTRLTDDTGATVEGLVSELTIGWKISFGCGPGLGCPGMAALVEGFDEHRAYFCLAGRVFDLLAGQVGDVEGVDNLFAEGGDVRGGDVEGEVGKRACDLREQAGPVE